MKVWWEPLGGLPPLSSKSGTLWVRLGDGSGSPGSRSRWPRPIWSAQSMGDPQVRTMHALALGSLGQGRPGIPAGPSARFTGTAQLSAAGRGGQGVGFCPLSSLHPAGRRVSWPCQDPAGHGCSGGTPGPRLQPSGASRPGVGVWGTPGL